jgi:hypothetical protein
LVYLAAYLPVDAAGAGPEAAPPKLKKFERLCPLIALAKILGQYD